MNVSMSRTAVAVLLMVSGAAMTQPYGISVSTSGRDSGLGDKANSPSVSEQPMKSRIRRLICSSLRKASGARVFFFCAKGRRGTGSRQARLHWYAASLVTSRRC